MKAFVERSRILLPATAKRSAPSLRVLAAVLAACCLALGIAAAPAMAAPRQAADTPPPLSQLTITSVSNGYSLDDQNGTPGTGSIIVTNGSPGYDENWHVGLIGGDDDFTIVNNTTGLCIDAGLPLRQQNCDGRSTENWYFQPVAGSSGAFMIRQEGTGNCLDLLLAAPYSDAWTDSYGCNGTAAQQWNLPSDAYRPAWTMAVTHAAAQCQSNASTCTFNAASQSPAAPLPVTCVSPVWYNATSAPVTWVFSITNTSGWSDALNISGNISPTADAGLVVQGKVTGTLTGGNTFTYNISQTLGNTLTIPVPAGEYGWVGLAELAEQVTGTWTFDLGGFPWTAADTVTVPLVTDSTGGASVYIAKTSPTFTSCSA
jgi:hypothetical protein